jgi:hypothetical protein
MDIRILQSRISKDIAQSCTDFRNLIIKNMNVHFHDPKVRGIYGLHDYMIGDRLALLVSF